MDTWQFIALWPSDADASTLASAASQVAGIVPGSRVEEGDRLHLTIAFLGACGARDLVVAAQACTDAAMAARGGLIVRLDRIAAFGNGHVLAAEPDEASVGSLLHVHEVARGRLLHGGVQVDSRPFRPHVSLVRLSGNGITHVGGVRVPLLPRQVRFDRIALVSSTRVAGAGRSWRVREQWRL